MERIRGELYSAQPAHPALIQIRSLSLSLDCLRRLPVKCYTPTAVATVLFFCVNQDWGYFLTVGVVITGNIT